MSRRQSIRQRLYFDQWNQQLKVRRAHFQFAARILSRIVKRSRKTSFYKWKDYCRTVVRYQRIYWEKSRLKLQLRRRIRMSQRLSFQLWRAAVVLEVQKTQSTIQKQLPFAFRHWTQRTAVHVRRRRQLMRLTAIADRLYRSNLLFWWTRWHDRLEIVDKYWRRVFQIVENLKKNQMIHAFWKWKLAIEKQSTFTALKSQSVNLQRYEENLTQCYHSQSCRILCSILHRRMARSFSRFKLSIVFRHDQKQRLYTFKQKKHVWNQWMAWNRAKHQLVSAVKAIIRITHRRLGAQTALAFRRWCSGSEAKHIQRVLQHKFLTRVLSRHQKNQMSLGFHLWRRRLRTNSRACELVYFRLRIKYYKTISAFWMRWVCQSSFDLQQRSILRLVKLRKAIHRQFFTKMKRLCLQRWRKFARIQTRILNLLYRKYRCSLLDSFLKWVAFMRWQRSLMTILNRIQQHRVLRLKRKALELWLKTAEGTTRRILFQLYTNWRIQLNRTRALALSRWRFEVMAERQMEKRKLLSFFHVLTKYRSFLISLTFQSWKTKKGDEPVAILRHILVKRYKKSLVKAWKVWQSEIQAQKVAELSRKALLDRFDLKKTCVSQSQVFHAWKSFYLIRTMRKYNRILIFKRLVRRKDECRLQNAWIKWRDIYLPHLDNLKHKLQILCRVITPFVTRSVSYRFNHWKLLEKWEKRLSQLRYWKLWDRYLRHRRHIRVVLMRRWRKRTLSFKVLTMKHWVAVTIDSRQSRRKCMFLQWKSTVRSIQTQRKRLKKRLKYQNRLCLQIGWRRWCIFVSVNQIHTVLSYLQRWKLAVKHRKRIRNVLRQMLKRILRQTLVEWRLKAHVAAIAQRNQNRHDLLQLLHQQTKEKMKRIILRRIGNRTTRNAISHWKDVCILYKTRQEILYRILARTAIRMKRWSYRQWQSVFRAEIKLRLRFLCSLHLKTIHRKMMRRFRTWKRNTDHIEKNQVVQAYINHCTKLQTECSDKRKAIADLIDLRFEKESKHLCQLLSWAFRNFQRRLLWKGFERWNRFSYRQTIDLASKKLNLVRQTQAEGNVFRCAVLLRHCLTTLRGKRRKLGIWIRWRRHVAVKQRKRQDRFVLNSRRSMAARTLYTLLWSSRQRLLVHGLRRWVRNDQALIHFNRMYLNRWKQSHQMVQHQKLHSRTRTLGKSFRIWRLQSLNELHHRLELRMKHFNGWKVVVLVHREQKLKLAKLFGDYKAGLQQNLSQMFHRWVFQSMNQTRILRVMHRVSLQLQRQHLLDSWQKWKSVSTFTLHLDFKRRIVLRSLLRIRKQRQIRAKWLLWRKFKTRRKSLERIIRYSILRIQSVAWHRWIHSISFNQMQNRTLIQHLESVLMRNKQRRLFKAFERLKYQTVIETNRKLHLLQVIGIRYANQKYCLMQRKWMHWRSFVSRARSLQTLFLLVQARTNASKFKIYSAWLRWMNYTQLGQRQAIILKILVFRRDLSSKRIGFQIWHRTSSGAKMIRRILQNQLKRILLRAFIQWHQWNEHFRIAYLGYRRKRLAIGQVFRHWKSFTKLPSNQLIYIVKRQQLLNLRTSFRLWVTFSDKIGLLAKMRRYAELKFKC